MENGVYLLLGSNLGNREKNIFEARNSIQITSAILASSSLYQTQAWGNKEQPDFLNQVVQIACNQSPQKLLTDLMAIEKTIGRLRGEKWGPRIIDIDILFFGQTILNEVNLVLPHPGIAMRRFTLQPMVEIAPEFIHPILNKSCTQLLIECKDRSVVSRIRF